MKGTVNAPDGLRVRSAPNMQGHRLGLAPNGSTVHIVKTVDGWHQVNLWPDRGADATVTGWVSAEYVVTETPPVVDKGTSAASLLGIHQLADKAKARESLDNGARAVMVFEDATLAHQLSFAHPDAIIMHRKYFKHAPSPRDMIAQHGVNPDETGNPSRAWYRGINEFDAPGFDGDERGILKRAAWDLECAAILKRAAPNARWIAGGFSHGTPDFTQPGICEAVRRGYADAYNRGDIVSISTTTARPGQVETGTTPITRRSGSRDGGSSYSPTAASTSLSARSWRPRPALSLARAAFDGPTTRRRNSRRGPRAISPFSASRWPASRRRSSRQPCFSGETRTTGRAGGGATASMPTSVTCAGCGRRPCGRSRRP